MKLHTVKKYFRIVLFLTMLTTLFASCKKEYSIENAGIKGPLPTGNWQFSEGGTDYAGSIDTVYIKDGGSVKEMHLVGKSNDGTQSFHLVIFANDFVKGTYKASAYQSTFEYGSGAPSLYSANQLNGEFLINITSINQSLITGTFSGTAVKNARDTVQIVTGMFKSVLKNGNTAPTSSGVLGDNNGNCEPATVNGNYKQGIVMNPGNSVEVQVTVAVPGTFYIYTDLVNGVSFSASGTFAQAGTQSVTLLGAGIPEQAGEKQFAIHFGNSQCAFKVTFAPGTAPSGDYYPLTNQSNWLYTDGIDEKLTKITGGTFSWNSNNYNVIGVYDNVNDPSPADTFAVIRKGNGLYYSYNDFRQLVQSSQPVIVENIFLKDNVAQGTSWDGPEFSVVVNNVTVKYHFKFTIKEKAVPATIGSFNFPDVIKVTAQLYSGATYLGIQEERWYARNVGLIYFGGDISGTWSVKNFQIF